jgi:hypothetical protein
MNREEIANLAVEAGLPAFIYPELIAEADWKNIEIFAKLVAAKEREVVLDLVDAYAKNNIDLAESIRARGDR